ncbi:MAG: NAD(P)-dependent alcohol dehydrogenase [Desulfovibrio sp.]|nr:MAG: NAD(P)-dependent alcohol dehydrogenase [Desulfovibrio sp.]
MQAAIYQEYGPPEVLRVQEVDTPEPGDKDVLVKVMASSVGFGDLIARDFKAVTPGSFTMPWLFWFLAKLDFGFSKPKRRILGAEYSGVVAAVGKDVTQWKEGDQVFGYLAQAFGAYAEYVRVKENAVLAPKPEGLSHEQAAVIPYGALTAMNLLKKVHIKPGSRVLVNGASGNQGSFAVQFLKHAGMHVTGVCSTPRVEFVRSLGADQVIDYTQEDFTGRGDKYDLIFDVLGKSSFSRVKNSLTDKGRYLRASFKAKHLLQMLWTGLFSKKKVVCGLAMESPADLAAIKELVEAGALRSPLDRTFPLEQVAGAHAYVESGQAKGKIAVSVVSE